MTSPCGPFEILLVDDCVHLRSVVSIALSSDGNRVTVAANGEEALALFAPGKFDVVLTDFVMPKGNGADLASAIRQRDPHQPIILFSGSADAISAGGKPDSVDLILRKQISLLELTSAVSRVRESSRRQTN